MEMDSCYNEIILEILDSLNIDHDTKILDFGCGTGSLVKFLNLNKYLCYGVDIHEEKIDTAKKLFKKNKLDPEMIKRIKINRNGYYLKDKHSYRIPFPDNFFDLIISFQVFEHVHNLDETVKELKRVLKKNGKIYLEFGASYSLIEGHINIPLVHFFPYGRFREKYIYFFAKMKKIENAKKYSQDSNLYLKNCVFYRPYKKFDEIFIKNGFIKIDYTYERRKLRLAKDKVFTIKDLLKYKLRKHQFKSEAKDFDLFVKYYLIIHSFFYKYLKNRIIVFIKK